MKTVFRFDYNNEMYITLDGAEYSKDKYKDVSNAIKFVTAVGDATVSYDLAKSAYGNPASIKGIPCVMNSVVTCDDHGFFTIDGTLQLDTEYSVHLDKDGCVLTPKDSEGVQETVPTNHNEVSAPMPDPTPLEKKTDIVDELSSNNSTESVKVTTPVVGQQSDSDGTYIQPIKSVIGHKSGVGMVFTLRQATPAKNVQPTVTDVLAAKFTDKEMEHIVSEFMRRLGYNEKQTRTVTETAVPITETAAVEPVIEEAVVKETPVYKSTSADKILSAEAEMDIEEREPIVIDNQEDLPDNIAAFVNKIPKVLFGTVPAYISKPIEDESIVNVQYCTENGWMRSEDWFCIDETSQVVRYFYSIESGLIVIPYHMMVRLRSA